MCSRMMQETTQYGGVSIEKKSRGSAINEEAFINAYYNISSAAMHVHTYIITANTYVRYCSKTTSQTHTTFLQLTSA